MIEIFSPKTWNYRFSQMDPIGTHSPTGPDGQSFSVFPNQNQEQQPANEERTIYKIPKYKIEWLDGKIGQINKAAKKLGLQPIGYKVLRSFAEEHNPQGAGGLKEMREFMEIELFGESPKLKTPSGKTYQFMSRIMHAEGGNILKNVPGVELPPEFRTVPPKCQHCNYNRQRKDTFVLRDEDSNQYIQVGSNCIKDFLGHPSANMYASWAESLADLNIELDEAGRDDGFGGGGGEVGYGIESFLTLVYAVIKAQGWLGRANAQVAGKAATVDIALSMHHAKDSQTQEDLKRLLSQVNGDDKQMISDALEWARGLKDGKDQNIAQLTDYYWNLSVACSSPVVTRRTTGIVASLPVAYNKAVLSKLNPDQSMVAGAKGSLYVGRGVITEERMYGSETSYQFKDEAGKMIQWSGDPVAQPLGSTINIEGTVVGYSRVFDAMTTRLARVKVLDDAQYQEKKNQVQNEVQGPTEPAPVYREGDKVTIDVSIMDVREVDSQWGGSTLYLMVDKWGNTLKCFTNALGLDKGERLNITATVKKVGDYNGRPDIQITRIKVNRREVAQGAEDNRLSPVEEKALKKQIGGLQKQLQGIEQAGFVNDTAYHKAAIDASQPLDPLFRIFRNYSTNYQHTNPIYLVEHANEVESIIGELVSSVSAIMDKRIQDSTQYPTSVQYIQTQKESLNNQLANVPEMVRAFQVNAANLIERIKFYQTSKPEMERLSNELQVLERKFSLHKQDVKQFGPKTAGKNWLSRIIAQRFTDTNYWATNHYNKFGPVGEMEIYRSPDFPNVFLGGYYETDDAANVAGQALCQVFDCRDLPEIGSDSDFWDMSKYEQIKEKFDNKVTQLISLIQTKNCPIYVHCALGANRSVSVLAAALSKLTGKRLDQVLGEMKQARSVVSPQDPYYLMALDHSPNDPAQFKKQRHEMLVNYDESTDFQYQPQLMNQELVGV
jgi:hypothetical protein